MSKGFAGGPAFSYITEVVALFQRLITNEDALSAYSTEDMAAFAEPYLHNCAFLYALYAHTFKAEAPTGD